MASSPQHQLCICRMSVGHRSSEARLEKTPRPREQPVTVTSTTISRILGPIVLFQALEGTKASRIVKLVNPLRSLSAKQRDAEDALQRREQFAQRRIERNELVF